MRTTIELPDVLYRSLKARAALSGTTLRELIQQLIEQGLQSQQRATTAGGVRRAPPPVLIPPCGTPILALSRDEMHRIDDEEDELKLA